MIFAPAAVGTEVTGVVHLRNVVPHAVDYAFILPDDSPFYIHPRVGHLEHGHDCRVTLYHNPKKDGATPRVDHLRLPCLCRPVEKTLSEAPLLDPAHVVWVDLYASVVAPTIELDTDAAATIGVHALGHRRFIELGKHDTARAP